MGIKKGWITALWLLNGALILAVGGTALWMGAARPAPAAAGGTASPLPPKNAATSTSTPFKPVTPPSPTRSAPTPTSPPTPTPVFVIPSPTQMGMGYIPMVIGHSVEGRPLEVYRFGTGPDVRLIVADIHGGNEWNTKALAEALISWLRENPQAVPADKTLFILPCLNPDGEARAHTVDGRVNAHGVDLNRNWPYRWKADWDHDACWHYRPVTAGDYPASEPETVALMHFIERWRPSALISYHSAALGVFAGGVPDFPPSMRLAKALAEAGGYQYPPIDIGCEYTGDLTDWASSVMGIPAVDIELTNHTDTDFEKNLDVLSEFLRWQP